MAPTDKGGGTGERGSKRMGFEIGGAMTAMSPQRRGRRARELWTNPKRRGEETSTREGIDLQTSGGRNPNWVWRPIGRKR